MTSESLFDEAPDGKTRSGLIVDGAEIRSLREHAGPAGEIHVLEPLPWVDFRRLYVVNLPHRGAFGGGHAHKALRQVLLTVAGCVQIVLKTPRSQRSLELRPLTDALSLEPGIWREYVALHGPATLLCLATQEYLEEDYIRDWSAYCTWFDNE